MSRGPRRAAIVSGRHAASPARRITTAVLVVTAALGLAVVVALSSTGGTFALLTARATTSPGATTITSGSADLSLGALALPDTPLYPGATVHGVVTARNTGDVPLDLSVEMARTAPQATPIAGASGAATTAPSVSVALGAASSAAACRAGSTRATWSGSLESRAPAAAGVSMGRGTSVVLCLSLTMPTNASASQQGLSTDFTMTITGTQA